MAEPIGDFKPSNKFCLLTREMFNDLKEDVQRIQRADSLDYAKECATFMLDKLKKRFEPEHAREIEQYLQQRTDYLAGHSQKRIL